MELPVDPRPLGVERRPRNQPPSSLACTACREKHLKCDAKLPICRRCQDNGSVCVYKQSRRGFKKRKTSTFDTDAGGKEGLSRRRFPTAPFTPPSVASLVDSSSLAIADMNFDGNGNENPFAIEINSDGNHPTPYSMVSENMYQTDIQPDTVSSIEKSVVTKNGQADELTRSYQSGSVDLTAAKASEAHLAGTESEIDTLIDIYYTKFNGGHPFLIPRMLYRSKPALIPTQLKAVMLFAASHFVRGLSPDNLQAAAENITSDGIPKDGHRVQGLMVLGISLYARFEKEPAIAAIDQAIDLALNLGMHLPSFALKHGMGNLIVEESWRRTWWELYTMDGVLATLSSARRPFRLQNIQTDIPLPCEESDYAECRSMPPYRTQGDFLERAFATETYDYSSMAYKIEAVRLAGNVLSLGTDIVASTDAQVERVDVNLADFVLSLPPTKRHLIEQDGRVDEVLFSAHNIINCALIMLHRPRSNLIYIRNHYPTPCTRQEAIGTPVSTYEAHTYKAIKAANAISNAIALQTPLAMHSPCFVCAIVLAAVVHLPAYSVEARDRSSTIKERLQLTINALNIMGETWPMAKAVKKQISQFAREMFSSRAAATGSSTAHAQIQQFDIESMMDDQTWLDELSYIDPMPESASTEPVSMTTLAPAVNIF